MQEETIDAGKKAEAAKEHDRFIKDKAVRLNNPPAKVGMKVNGLGGIWQIIEIDGDFVKLQNEEKTIEWMNYIYIEFSEVKKWWQFWK